MREPHLSGADAIRAAYEAKARAELADADALIGAAPGTWEGPVIGPRIAFLVAGGEPTGANGGLLDPRVADAVAKAADVLGAGKDVFTIVTRPEHAAPADSRSARLRLAIEAVDPLAVIALDPDAASDLADAFGLDDVHPGHAVRACGRSIGSAGDFAASLDDPEAKARAWSAMKAVAASAGLEQKGRPKASR